MYTHNTEICVAGNRFLLTRFPNWVGLGAFLLWTPTYNLPCYQRDCTPKPYPEVPHYCLSVLLELKLALHTGLHPLWPMYLCFFSHSHFPAALTLSRSGMHCQITLDGLAGEAPSARNLQVQFSWHESGSTSGPTCHASPGHSMSEAERSLSVGLCLQSYLSIM